MIARVQKRGELSTRVTPWMGPWWVVSADGQHMYCAKEMVTRQRRGLYVAQMSPYAKRSLVVTKEVNEVLITPKKQRDFDMEATRAAALRAHSEEWTAQVKWTTSTLADAL